MFSVILDLYLLEPSGVFIFSWDSVSVDIARCPLWWRAKLSLLCSHGSSLWVCLVSGSQMHEQRMLCGGLLCCVTVAQMAESVSKMEVNLGKSEFCRVSVMCMPGWEHKLGWYLWRGHMPRCERCVCVWPLGTCGGQKTTDRSCFFTSLWFRDQTQLPGLVGGTHTHQVTLLACKVSWRKKMTKRMW